MSTLFLFLTERCLSLSRVKPSARDFDTEPRERGGGSEGKRGESYWGHSSSATPDTAYFAGMSLIGTSSPPCRERNMVRVSSQGQSVIETLFLSEPVFHFFFLNSSVQILRLKFHSFQDTCMFASQSNLLCLHFQTGTIFIKKQTFLSFAQYDKMSPQIIQYQCNQGLKRKQADCSSHLRL